MILSLKIERISDKFIPYAIVFSVYFAIWKLNISICKCGHGHVTPSVNNVIHVFFYKNEVYKNISRLWELLKKKKVVLILKLWWGISTKYQGIYMVFYVNKKHWSPIQRFLEDMRHARESLHLENKNMLRTFLGLKLKRLRTSEGFLQFWCSYTKNV